MAAPINWNVNNLRNSGNSVELRHQINHNQMFDFQRPPQAPTNRFPPRMPPQQRPVPPSNPRFLPPRPLERHNFSPSNNMMQNRFQSIATQQNEHLLSVNTSPLLQGKGELQSFRQNIPPPIPPVGYEHQNQAQFQTFKQHSVVEHSGMPNFQPLNRDNFTNEMNSSTIHSSGKNTQEQTNVQLQPKRSQFRIDEEQQAKEDQRWLKNWLQGKSVKTEKPIKTTMKIGEAQEKTRHMMVLLARLQKNKQVLETLKHEDRSIWDQKLKEVLSIKAELESVQKELTSEENVRHLKTKVEQRKKKRERLKQHKEEMYRQQQEELAERERKSAEIDKAMQQLVEKQKLEKQEKDMQKEADEVLSQVRKKLSEANKSIQIVNSMQKLRKLRTDRLERQGVLHMYESQGHSSTNRLMFEAKLSNVTELLNKQLEIYKAEEAALKVHLETEQEETREKEREKARLRMIEKQKQERKKEEKMLFGNQKDPVPGDPLYPFRQYYDSASHSLDALIAIRREWDSYLTAPDVGSCIPENWVLPAEPASDTWATALESGHPT